MRREAAGTDISAGTSSSKKQPHGAHCPVRTLGKQGQLLLSSCQHFSHTFAHADAGDVS